MTPPQAGHGGLAGLRERLRGGVYASVRDARPADLEFRDAEALAGWPGDAFAALGSIRRVPDVGAPAAIGTMAGQMRTRRPLLAAVLFAPDAVLARLLDSFGATEQDLCPCWIAMCWTVEAAWLAVAGEQPGDGGFAAGDSGFAVDSGFAAGDGALLRPLAARLRFLVLSEPMRSRGESDEACWGRKADRVLGGSGLLARALGPGSWRLLAGRCQEARREWLGVLDAYQSHPLLSQAEPAELERELLAVVFRDGHVRPLGLSAEPLSERAPLTAEDRSVIADAIDRHLLPRFALVAVARLVLWHDEPLWRWARRAGSAAAALTGLAAVGCAIFLLARPAAVVAAACYLLICAGVLLPKAGLGAMWLLRMPAASAVGVIALVSFMPGGWLTTPPGGWGAVLALTAASFGYLLVEARNHGVSRGAAVPRALLVVVVGAVHAVMVSVIGLVVVAPAFVSAGGHLAALWTRPAYGHAGTVLALAAAWCLAVGVFSQILWDDRPITAPLAHLSWRNR